MQHHRHHPRSFSAPLTMILLGLCVFLFLFGGPLVPWLLYDGPAILHGEVWRLVTPILLHVSPLHILFNMLWLWMLGRPVEQRIGTLKLLLLTLVIAVISNTAQYFMTGPYFLGYSGVIVGLAGFIWSRQKVAPWEGYPIQSATLVFLFAFVLAMALLQGVTWLLHTFTSFQFPFPIANTAHIVGGLVGVALGRLRFFSWRPV